MYLSLFAPSSRFPSFPSLHHINQTVAPYMGLWFNNRSNTTMTTPAAESLYLAQHLMEWEGVPYAIFNPHNKPVDDLPIIYGFNNGGSLSAYFLHACLISEDGEELGQHMCTDEGYMRSDLGVLEGSRFDRHELFREKYPDGYRMDFVPYSEVSTHQALNEAFRLRESKF